LVSVGHLTGQEGASDISADYSTVERWVLIALREIKPDQLVGGIGKADVLTEKLAELAGVEARLEDIGRMLADPDTQLPPQIGKAMTSLTLKRERLQQEVEKARQENATADSKPLTQIRDIFDELETGTEAEIRNKRLKLRGLIACLVERIEIEGIRFGKKRAGTRIWVVMSSGPVATCYQYPDGTGGVSWGGVAWLPAKGKYCGEARPAR
jgi:DNA-binding transcriptional MerR regulator